MKAITIFALTALTSAACMQVTPQSYTSFATDLDSVNVEWNKGFSATKVNQSRGTKIVAEAISGSIRDYIIGKLLIRGLDSMDATTASDEALAKAQINGDIQAATIASNERIALEKLALEAAEVAP